MRTTVEIRKLNSEHMIEGNDDWTIYFFFLLFHLAYIYNVTLFLSIYSPGVDTYTAGENCIHLNPWICFRAYTHTATTTMTTTTHLFMFNSTHWFYLLSLARISNAVIDHDFEHDRTAHRHSFCSLFSFALNTVSSVVHSFIALVRPSFFPWRNSICASGIFFFFLGVYVVSMKNS